MATMIKTSHKGRQRDRHLASAYMTAREYVVEAGFGSEIDWQDTREFTRLDESDFLREAAWVVLSAGMADSVIRRVFHHVSDAFFGWRSASEIADQQECCVARARLAFRNERKLQAIAHIAESIAECGFGVFKRQLEANGPTLLQSFDFIGPVTCFHLAKNIGLDVVKPDRHLLRAAMAAQVADPAELCCAVAGVTGDRLATVDLVFWRYGTLRQNFKGLFASW